MDDPEIEAKHWLKNAPWRKQKDGSYGKRGESRGKSSETYKAKK